MFHTTRKLLHIIYPRQ